MSQEYVALRGSSALQLRCLDRILSELARPALDEESIVASTRNALVELGICVGGDASRRDLVESLWVRKRALLRQMSALGDWGPTQPVA